MLVLCGALFSLLQHEQHLAMHASLRSAEIRANGTRWPAIRINGTLNASLAKKRNSRTARRQSTANPSFVRRERNNQRAGTRKGFFRRSKPRRAGKSQATVGGVNATRKHQPRPGDGANEKNSRGWAGRSTKFNVTKRDNAGPNWRKRQIVGDKKEGKRSTIGSAKARIHVRDGDTSNFTAWLKRNGANKQGMKATSFQPLKMPRDASEGQGRSRFPRDHHSTFQNLAQGAHFVCPEAEPMIPMISVLTSTSAHRSKFYKNLMRNFQHQTYPNKELIILGCTSPQFATACLVGLAAF